MSRLLKDFVLGHPAVTLSHTKYRHHFRLGNGINIILRPTQCLRSFVEAWSEGSPYHFLVVGQLMSFKVVEDAIGLFFLWGFSPMEYLTQSGGFFFVCFKFGHFLSVNLGKLQPSLVFTTVFWGQLATLQKIEEEESIDDRVHVQVLSLLSISSA